MTLGDLVVFHPSLAVMALGIIALIFAVPVTLLFALAFGTRQKDDDSPIKDWIKEE